MKINVTNLAVGAALAAGAYFALNYFANGIQYNFKGLKWLGTEGFKLRLSMLYTLTNTNDIPATVTNLKGRLMYGEYKINELNVAKAITVNPGESEDIDVRFTVSPGQLLAEILRFFENRDGFSKFKIKGTMTGKIGEVPFAMPLNETLSLA